MDVWISIITIGSAESLNRLVVVQRKSQCLVSHWLCLKKIPSDFKLVRNGRQ